jgi:intracellular septation protein A
MKQAITLITLILFFNLYAQTPFYHAKISLTNSETKEGYAELPQIQHLANQYITKKVRMQKKRQ